MSEVLDHMTPDLSTGDLINLSPLQQNAARDMNRRINAASDLALLCAEEIRWARRNLWATIREWFPEADGFELRLIEKDSQIHLYRTKVDKPDYH